MTSPTLNRPQIIGYAQIALSILFLGVVAFTLLNTPWQLSAEPPLEPTTAALAVKLLGEGGFILPVEIAASLLLSAILGAIVLVREK